MDINNVLNLLSGTQLNSVSKKSGADKADVTSVLTAALPLLIKGESETSTEKKVAKKTGISLETVTAILTVALPLLQSALGNKPETQAASNSNQNTQAGGLTGLLGGLLVGGNGASALGALGSLLDVSGSSSSSTSSSGKKKPAKKKTGTSSSTGKKKTSSSTSSGKKKTTAASSAAKKKTSSTAKKKTAASTAKKTTKK